MSCGPHECHDGHDGLRRPHIQEAETRELSCGLYNPAVAEGAVGSAVESCAQQGFVLCEFSVEQFAHGVVDGDNLDALALQIVAELSVAEKYAGHCSSVHKLEVVQQLDDCLKTAAAAAAVQAAGLRRGASDCHTREPRLIAAV